MEPVCWAWIPARGGSKSIPRKNLQLLHGIPLLSHSIRYAQAQWPRISRVIVSTDDDEIASLARQEGSLVVMRPPHLATDTSRDDEVLRHLVQYFQNQTESPDYWVQLRPTYPLRPPSLFSHIYEQYLHSPSQPPHALRTVVLSPHPPFKMYRVEPDTQYVRPLFSSWGSVEKPYEAPRQELPTCYWHNGCLDIISHRVFLEEETLTPSRTIAFQMPDHETLDIDEPHDLARAEAQKKKTE